MLNNKVSFSSLFISSVLCSAVTFSVCYAKFKRSPIHSTSAAVAATLAPTVVPSCGTVSHRLEGYKYIKPLLYVDKTCETGHLANLKTELVGQLDVYKQSGVIDNASIYLKLLGQGSGGEFISINENNYYHPGSLIKLPILITYMTMEEKHPGTLDKKIVFTQPKGGIPHQTYNSHQIEPGKSYSIKELLKYMVAFSDNNATYLLNENVDLEAFKKMFSDFGLIVPDVHDMNYQISAKDYSAFLKVIYNSGYLTISNSEYVAELLSQCDFKDGMQSGLPENVQLAHKFGEWGDRKDPNVHQLSESGIVYLNNSPYLITVMTQGRDVKKLPEVLKSISKLTFNKVKETEVPF